MRFLTRAHARKVAGAALLAGAAALLASCASPQPTASIASKARSKEYFAESEYGVKASPRVSTKRSRLPRGGGREQVGRPYKIKGQWYHPREEPGYRSQGIASWYGDAFHGRLTANGEIYDMTHLTAAHPTMPLPSYARVTNTRNGHSVIVRVNDRGPFARGRVIDLSKRAAEMLDYTHSGVAQVKVEYVGRAPLHGQDDAYLMASYRPGPGGAPGAPDPSDGLPSGVMIAMAGPTPNAAVGSARAFPGELSASGTPAATPVAFQPGAFQPGDGPDLPAAGPLVPERPFDGLLIASNQKGVRLLSYADMRIEAASAAFDAFDRAGRMDQARIAASWQAQGRANEPSATAESIVVGTYMDRTEADRIARRLEGLGRLETAVESDEGGASFTVSLHADGTHGLDTMLQAAWDAGASDAMILRR
jgi:rare lipoprotein A